MRDDMDALLAKVLKVQGFRICLRIAGGLLGDAGGWFPSIQTFNASGRHAETIFPIKHGKKKNKGLDHENNELSHTRKIKSPNKKQ